MEEILGCKCPGVGCQLHVIERYEDAVMRSVHGPTTSPEEGISKKFKAWMNSSAEKHTNDVKF